MRLQLKVADTALFESWKNGEASKNATISLLFGHGITVGDYVRMSFDTNKSRRRVISVSLNNCETSVFMRPSKGYAKHVRRIKAKKKG